MHLVLSNAPSLFPFVVFPTNAYIYVTHIFLHFFLTSLPPSNSNLLHIKHCFYSNLSFALLVSFYFNTLRKWQAVIYLPFYFHLLFAHSFLLLLFITLLQILLFQVSRMHAYIHQCLFLLIPSSNIPSSSPFFPSLPSSQRIHFLLHSFNRRKRLVLLLHFYTFLLLNSFFPPFIHL